MWYNNIMNFQVGGCVLKIIICDDKKEEQKKYTDWINNIAKKHDIAVKVKAYDSADVMLSDSLKEIIGTGIIFMDVNMPGTTGDLAALKLRELGYENEIIFLTVSKQHFINAFDAKALHYIVKNEAKLEEFERIFLLAVSAQQQKQSKFVMYSSAGKTISIPIDKILYYEAHRGIVKVYYDNGKIFEFPQRNITVIANDLEEHGFCRTHRAIIVSLSAVESITYNRVTLRNGAELPMSRNKYAELKKSLGSFVTQMGS